MRVRDAADLVDAHEWAMRRHNDWKSRSATTDLVAANKWSQVWASLSDEPDPLVENTLLEALEDKAAAAASVVPRIQVAPSRGTRADRGETDAERKRRVFVSYQQRSNIAYLRSQWNLDWFQHGARYGLPWVDFNEETRFPWFLRQDPRHAFPLSHDSRGNLTSIFFTKQRRIQDIEQEWGKQHEAIQQLRTDRHQANLRPSTTVEEVWYFDTDHWGVALYDSASLGDMNDWNYRNPQTVVPKQSGRAYWLAEREAHMMSGCPVIEDKRPTFDGEYRGALDAMIPGLGVAQALMSAVLADVAQQIGAPVLLDNVINPEDFGPEAILEGTGDGRARMEALRQPSNFEATGHIDRSLESTRRVGKYPQQRTGEAGASIVSGKGTTALMGNFNSELAEAQRGQLAFERDLLARTAEFDAKWCDTRKRVLGFDDGTAFEETYTPSILFKNDDYRVDMTFGGGLGLDQQNFMIQLATAKNLNGLSMRTFMQKTGLVDDVLGEEAEMLLEQIAAGFVQFTIQQAMESGNMQPLIELSEAIDGENKTARAAVIDTIKKAFAVPGGQPNGQPGPAATPDAILQNRALEAGGIPGNAEGLPAPPQITDSLRRMLPGNLSRAQGEVEGAVA